MTDQILGFYTSGEVADGVVRNLYKAGFRRSGVLSKSHSGKLTIRRTTYWPVLGSLSAAATAVSLSLHSGIWEKSIVFSMLMGFSILASFLYRRRYCLDQMVLNKYSRWVLEDETLIIVQAPEGSSSRVTETLNSGSVGTAATFIIRENRNDLRTTVEDKPTREPLTSDALREQAKDFAAQHRLCPPGKHRQYLLEELKESSQILVNVLKDVSEGSQLDKRMTPAAEWLLDNAYFIQGQITDIRNNLPADYDGKLPTLDGHSTVNRLRVEVLARDLIQNTDSRLTASNIIEYLQAYQTVAPLTIGELWVFPLLLRFVLVDELKCQSLQVGFRQREKERADFWANRLLAASRRDPDQLLGYLADLARERFELAAHFAVRLAGILYDEEAVLLPVQRWLERKLEFPLQEIIRQEHAHQATCQISIANAIGSLRQLAQRDWRDVFEAVSCVEAILRQDPAGIYSMSDFSTRNRCRDRIEKISHYAKVSEVEVARQAISLAQGADHPSDSRCLHVGYYLIADGRDKLESRLNCKLPLAVHIEQYVHRHPSFVYLGSLVLLTSLIVTLPLLKGRGFEGPPWELLLLAALSILPASELALQTINLLVSWTLPPRVLPKLLFKDGIPEQHRTLVVVPMMLLTPDSVREEVEKLEVRYLANPDPQLRFALFQTSPMRPSRSCRKIQELLELVVRGIGDLNTKYP